MNQPNHKTFDVMGRVLRVTDQLGRIYETSYDKDGNATSLLLHDYRSQATGDFPRDIFVERSTYDAASRKLTSKVALGVVRRTAYDKANRPLSKTLEDFVDHDGLHRDVILESQQYDAAGHVVVQVKGGGKQRTASVHDAAGRVTCATLDRAGVDRVLDMM